MDNAYLRLSSAVMDCGEDFPPKERCYRLSGNDLFAMSPGDRVSFDTYFGSFSIDKWRKYTDAEQFALCVIAEGSYRISLFDATGELGTFGCSFKSGERKSFEIPESASGAVYFEAEAISEGARLIDAHYAGVVSQARAVKIALNICTYRREDYVYENMGIVDVEIATAFVIDNGRTLDRGRLPSHVRLFYNRNTGGSGGFTRGMGEVLRAPEPFTHIVMMDDDIRAHPETLRRLHAFLTCMKPEYSMRPIAGAMLNRGTAVQHESGGIWCDTHIEIRKGGLNLGDFDSVVFNEVEEPFDFGGWWFFVIPVEAVRQFGLPQQFFIKHDDVEYSLRMKMQPLTLNGICVWHELFDGKYNAAIEYYLARNSLCVNELHRKGFTKSRAKLWILKLYLVNIFRYRYDKFEMILKAVEDYVDESWKAADPEALHKQILAMAQPISYAGERPEAADHVDFSTVRRASLPQKIAIALTLNGMIFPLRGEAAVPAYKDTFLSYFRKKRVYNAIEGTDEGFWVVCDRKRAFRLFIQCLKAMRKIDTLPSDRLS